MNKDGSQRKKPDTFYALKVYQDRIELWRSGKMCGSATHGDDVAISRFYSLVEINGMRFNLKYVIHMAASPERKLISAILGTSLHTRIKMVSIPHPLGEKERWPKFIDGVSAAKFAQKCLALKRLIGP